MKCLALGVEIGGTKLQLAIGDARGNIVATRREQADPALGAAGVLAWLEREIPLLLQSTKAPETPLGEEPVEVYGIGIGFGGPVESSSGKILVSHQVAGWEGIELKRWFEERFNLPTIVANDANAAGWAEYCCGAGRGARNFFYMNIGSGIGGALVIDGRLHDGQGSGAGEIGHTYVPDWRAEVAGAGDKLEHICSGWSIEKRLRAGANPPSDTPLGQLCGGRADAITCPMLAEAARRGDEFARTEIDRVAQSLGLALANVITLFHPERIALGGGVSLMGNALLEPIRRYVDTYVFGPFRNRYTILSCELEEAAVIVGALLLAPGHPELHAMTRP